MSNWPTDRLRTISAELVRLLYSDSDARRVKFTTEFARAKQKHASSTTVIAEP